MKENYSVNLSVLQDAYQDLPEAIINAYISEHYRFAITSVQCKKENYSKFSNYMKNNWGVTEYKFDISTNNKYFYLEDTLKKILCIVDAGVNDIYDISMFAQDISVGEEVYTAFKKFEHIESDVYVDFNTLSLAPNGKVSEYSTGLKITDFEDDKDIFYPYLDCNELFRQFTISNENILVLSGTPGTGKTRATNLYIRWLLENPDICKNYDIYSSNDNKPIISVCYVKNEDLLSTDGFWEILTHRNPALVFLDDSDHSLTSRNNEVTSSEDVMKNKFLSQLLSFTDGITKNNVKFIITTNLAPEHIDTAVLRKGRTFDILKFRKLSLEEAKNIWKEYDLNVENFFNYFSEDDCFIPACDLGSYINKELNVIKTGISLKPYIKEPDISILNKTSMKSNQTFFG